MPFTLIDRVKRYAGQRRASEVGQLTDLVCLPLTAFHQEAQALFGRDAPAAEGTGAWFSTLARTTMAPGEEAFLAAVRGKNGLASALPLVRISKSKFRGLTAPYSTSFGPAALTERDAYDLGASLHRLVSGRIRLDAMDMSLPLNQAFLRGLSRSSLVTTRYRHFANWYEDITSWEAFWATRPTRMRETVRRKGRKLKDAGAQFLLMSSPEEMPQGIASYREVYADSGKIAEPHPDFMAELMKSLALCGDVRLGLIMIGGKPVAAQLWLLRAGRATIFKLAHLPTYSSYSPGTLLTHWMFSQLVPLLPIGRVDFGRGDDRYKRDWMQSCTFREGIIACNPAHPAGLLSIGLDVLPTWAGALRRRMLAAW